MSGLGWQQESDPERLLVYLQKQGHDPSGRRLRLLGVACCRRIWDLLPEPQQRAVEAAERVAEGMELTDDEWARFADSVEDHEGFEAGCPEAGSATSAVYASFIDFRIHRVFHGCANARAWAEAARREEFDMIRDHEQKEQCRLVMEVFGDWFSGVAIEASCRMPTVLRLAQAAYDERRLPEGTLDPVRLAILADALEDAGCTEQALLSHCRKPGRHVRGCWVLDLIRAES